MDNWKQTLAAKLGSRKFWCAVAAYITSILTAFNVSDNTIVKVTTILGGIGALAVYILAEAYVDGKREAGIVYVDEDLDESIKGINNQI